ncbi:Os07g0461550, partial [Oryza sativa Japonica Group]
MCGGGVCLSFMRTWRIRERSVGLPGLVPWTTTTPGCFALALASADCFSLLLPRFSSPGISCGTISAIAFQYCFSASPWNFSCFAKNSCTIHGDDGGPVGVAVELALLGEGSLELVGFRDDLAAPLPL